MNRARPEASWIEVGVTGVQKHRMGFCLGVPIASSESYLSSMQLLEAIQWIWETRRRALSHGPFAGSKMAWTAVLQTDQ